MEKANQVGGAIIDNYNHWENELPLLHIWITYLLPCASRKSLLTDTVKVRKEPIRCQHVRLHLNRDGGLGGRGLNDGTGTLWLQKATLYILYNWKIIAYKLIRNENDNFNKACKPTD